MATKSIFKAVLTGDEESLLVLIRKGADLNGKDKQGLPPLHWAAYRGVNNTLRLLIEHGAEVNTANHIGYTPLMVASREGRIETVRLLLEHRADVNAQTNDQSTALTLAATYAHSGVVELLLEHGAQVQGKGGDYALLGAAFNGNSQNVAALLAAGANIRATNKDGKTVWDLASEVGRAEAGRAAVREILKKAKQNRLSASASPDKD